MSETEKKRVIQVVTQCAKEYRTHLENKNFAFVYGAGDQQAYIETVFEPRHFLHLTGVIVPKTISSVQFYERCLENKLALADFSLAPGGTTILKSQVLHELMRIHKTARMVGDYNASKQFLVTEKIVGTVRGCLGFRREAGKTYLVPNTALKEDSRDLLKAVHPLNAICWKEIKDAEYTHLSYVAKNLTGKVLVWPEGLDEKLSAALRTEAAIPEQ